MNQQFAKGVVTDTRLLKRTCESLIGICAGLIADGDLNNQEVVFLSTWLSENSHISNTWPAEIVFARVREILADGHISSEEREYLKKTLTELVGGSFSDTGSVTNGPTLLPVDENAKIVMQGSVFCFTGQFLYGTRSACERATIVRGGSCIASVTRKINYLVIGALASRDWKSTTHGTKIEEAVRLRAQGIDLKIVLEGDWADALTGRDS